MVAKAVLPAHPRKGIATDQRANQYTCRVGYDLNAKGQRVRPTQYLTADPDTATMKH